MTQPPRPITIGILDEVAHVQEVIPAWSRLFSATPCAPIALAPSWASTWLDHFGHGPRASGNRSEPYVITARRDGELVGIFPMLRARLGAGPVQVTSYVGMGQENADLGGPLTAPGDHEALSALAGAVAELADAPHRVVNLGRMADDDPFLHAVRSALPSPAFQLGSDWVEAFPYLRFEAFEDPARSVGRLLRSNDVPRRRRRLEELGAIEWIASDATTAGSELDEFLRLHDRRWADREASGPFASARGQVFLREAFVPLIAAGVLSTIRASVGGRSVGARLGATRGRWYLGMKSSWDPDLARFGPGHLLTSRVIEDALAAGLDGVDLMRGTTPHKEAWANGSRSIGYWTLHRGGGTARSDHALHRRHLGLRYRWRDGR